MCIRILLLIATNLIFSILTCNVYWLFCSEYAFLKVLKWIDKWRNFRSWCPLQCLFILIFKWVYNKGAHLAYNTASMTNPPGDLITSLV